MINRAEIFYGNSRNYCLSIACVKSMLWHLISDFFFGAIFGWKMGVAATPAPKGLRPQNQTKKLAHVRVFWVTCYLKIVFPNLQTMDPPLIRIKSWSNTTWHVLREDKFSLWFVHIYMYYIKYYFYDCTKTIKHGEIGSELSIIYSSCNHCNSHPQIWI